MLPSTSEASEDSSTVLTSNFSSISEACEVGPASTPTSDAADDGFCSHSTSEGSYVDPSSSAAGEAASISSMAAAPASCKG